MTLCTSRIIVRTSQRSSSTLRSPSRSSQHACSRPTPRAIQTAPPPCIAPVTRKVAIRRCPKTLAVAAVPSDPATAPPSTVVDLDKVGSGTTAWAWPWDYTTPPTQLHVSVFRQYQVDPLVTLTISQKNGALLTARRNSHAHTHCRAGCHTGRAPGRTASLHQVPLRRDGCHLGGIPFAVPRHAHPQDPAARGALASCMQKWWDGQWVSPFYVLRYTDCKREGGDWAGAVLWCCHRFAERATAAADGGRPGWATGTWWTG